MRNSGRHASGVADRIIARQPSAVDQGRARHRDGLARACVLVTETAHLPSQSQRFTAHQAIQSTAGQAGLGIAVVGLVAGQHAAYRQGFLRDAGLHGGRIADRVIAGQPRAVGQAAAADDDGFVAACIFVAEHARCARQQQRFTTDQPRQASTGQGRVEQAVIDFVAGRHTRHRQRLGRNVCAQSAWVADRIVAGEAAIAAIDQGRAAGDDGFAGAGILVRKTC